MSLLAINASLIRDGWSRPPKKWHIGTGRDKTGKMNYASALKNNSGYISCCTEDWKDANGKGSPYRVKQFDDFKEFARKGDIMFLHHDGLVRQWGVYTGEILSHRKGYKTPPVWEENPSGWAKDGEGLDRLRDQFHIKVDKWNDVSRQFKGKGDRKTLYEVTNENNYIQ
tara:strand:+ start:55 stop:561 length:507 start_codon:yes stop_codon:yes gene_type:complete